MLARILLHPVLFLLTVISRIITVTSYACRYLTVTLFISTMENPETIVETYSTKLNNELNGNAGFDK